MKKKKNENELNPFNKVLYLFNVIIIFSFCFLTLVKKQERMENYADVASTFTIKSIYGKQLVAKDESSSDLKYYVVLFNDKQYLIHSYTYYHSDSQYNNELNNSFNDIVYFDYQEKLIQKVVTKGYGNYLEIKENLTKIIGHNNLQILE